jgi:hypothetical protein
MSDDSFSPQRWPRGSGLVRSPPTQVAKRVSLRMQQHQQQHAHADGYKDGRECVASISPSGSIKFKSEWEALARWGWSRFHPLSTSHDSGCLSAGAQ